MRLTLNIAPSVLDTLTALSVESGVSVENILAIYVNGGLRSPDRIAYLRSMVGKVTPRENRSDTGARNIALSNR